MNMLLYIMPVFRPSVREVRRVRPSWVHDIPGRSCFQHCFLEPFLPIALQIELPFEFRDYEVRS